MNALDEAKRLFNETWDLLDLAERTPEQKALMLHKAHTSCYLWREANNPVNNARGEWQVSRVYSVLGYGEPALLHGSLSLELCTENNVGGLDLAFGYEAVARAYAVLGDSAEFERFMALGTEAAQLVQDAEDREYVLGEFNSIK